MKLLVAILFIVTLFVVFSRWRQRQRLKDGDTDAIIKAAMRLMGQNKYDELAALLQDKAEQGNGIAAQMLAELYSLEEFGMLDDAKARHWYAKAAELDPLLAVKQRTLLSFNVHPVLGGDKQQLESLLRPGAEAGDVDLQTQLGAMYFDNPLTDPDGSKALYWLKKAAEKGHAEAHFKLGRYYQSAEHGNDAAKAREQFELASAGGDSSAKRELAWLLLQNEHNRDDIRQGAALLEELAVEDQYTRVELGMMYLNGNLLARDLHKAEVLLRQAMEDDGDNLSAAFTLAELLLLHKHSNDAHTEAVAILTPMAEAWWTHAQFLLAQAYERGLGVRRHLPTAWQYYKLAATDHAPEHVQALEDLTKRLGQYEKTEAESSYQDFLNRFPISQSAQADMDQSHAIRLLQDGEQGKRDPDRAIELLERAVLGGNTFALDMLYETCLEQGHKVDAAVWAKLMTEIHGFLLSSGKAEATLHSLKQAFTETEAALYEVRLASRRKALTETA